VNTPIAIDVCLCTCTADLVARQKAAIAERKATKVGLASDTAWTGGHGWGGGGGSVHSWEFGR
jgi:hypothetical protein